MPKTFLLKGSTGTIAIGESSTINAAIDSPYSYLNDLNFHTELDYMQLVGKVSLSSATFAALAQPAAVVWDDGTGSGFCFTANSMVLMADSTYKPISKVQVGDLVLSKDKVTVNKVVFVEQGIDVISKYLYSPTPELKPFATINHPLFINNELSTPDPELTYSLHPWLGKLKKIDRPIITAATGKPVYNLWLTGDGTYIVNGFSTHSIIGNGGLLAKSFARGYLTNKQVCDILENMASTENINTRYGAYEVNRYLGLLNIDFIFKIISWGTKHRFSYATIKRFCQGLGFFLKKLRGI